MTEHPEDLLPGYVDGELAPAERRAVDAHLSRCERCRDDVAAARRAREALGQLEQVRVPAGLAVPALRRHRRAVGLRRAARWGAGLAAAAALVTVFAVSLPETPRRGEQAREDAAEGGGAEAEGPAETRLAAAPRFVQTDADYDQRALQALAGALVGEDTAFEGEAGEEAADGEDAVAARPTEAAATTENLDSPAAREALACVRRAGLRAEETDSLLYIEAARFQGDRAYVTALRKADAGVEIWVVGRAGCEIRFVATQQAGGG